MSPPFSVFLTPSGKFEPSSVSRILTSGLARGLGVHEYHSLIGATKVAGTPFRIGCARSSAFRRAGMDGQLLALNLPPPMNSVNHGHALVPNPETWNPSQPPPPPTYRSNARRCAAVCGMSFSQITTRTSRRFTSFSASQSLVAANA